MNGTPFAFPPPPPPPPQAATSPNTSAGSSFSRGGENRRWPRGSRGQGRGRGNTYRGLRGGNQQVARESQPGANNVVNNAIQYGGGSYPLPNYPSTQPPQLLAPSVHGTSSNSPSPYHHIPSQSDLYQTRPNYPSGYPSSQPQGAPFSYSSPGYYPQAQQSHSYQSQPPMQHTDHRYASPPVAMGPPLRLGFGDQQSIDQRQFPYNPHTHVNPRMSHHAPDPMPSYLEGPSYGSWAGVHHHASPRGRGGDRGRGRDRGRGHGQFNRRGNSDVSSASRSSSRKTHVAPAVPSFGNPLPLKPPISKTEDKKPGKKKKRRINQLGLTPKNEEHVSSSAEEDADEEVKLAAAVAPPAGAGQMLEFTYKGQTSSLQSSSDIASWIQERKKRFPTAARKAESDARLVKQRQERNQKIEEKRNAFEAERLLKRQLKTLEKDKQAATEKAKLKVEKLRRKLKKEERRIAKAEVKSLKHTTPEAQSNCARGIKRKRSRSDPKPEDVDDYSDFLVEDQPVGSAKGRNVDIAVIAESGTVSRTNDRPASEVQGWEEAEVEHASLMPGPLTPTSQTSMPEREHEVGQSAQAATEKADHQGQTSEPVEGRQVLDAAPRSDEKASSHAASMASSSMSVSSDDILDGDEDDETSSSGSSSGSSCAVDTDSEESEIATSRRVGAQKVPPPQRKHKPDRALCRDFLRTGRCRRGKRCRWRHALPDRGQKKVPEANLSWPERKSLHQRLVEQQEENEKAEKKAREEHQHDSKNDTQVKAAKAAYTLSKNPWRAGRGRALHTKIW